MCLVFRQRVIPASYGPGTQEQIDKMIAQALQEWFGDIVIDEGFEPSASVSFMNEALVIPNWDEDHLRATTFNFGIVPSWSKDGKTKPSWANARSETVDESRLYASLFKKRRCLVPVAGHYEFKKDEKGNSQGYLIGMLNDPFYCLAGIWSTWKTPEGRNHNTFALLTREPNELLAQVHDRQPVIIHHDYWDLWLESSEEDPAALKEALGPYPADELCYWPMDKYMNNLVKHKDDDKIVPIGEMVTLESS